MTSIIYPTTNLKAVEQLVIERGEGVYVYDEKGKKYLEGLAGLWCASLGYGNEELVEAAATQMRKLPYSHMFGGKTHRVGMELADKLAAMVPVKDARVFFGNSGSDANDSMIKMIHYYFDAIGKPEKRKIISREKAYHGITVAAATLTGLAVNHGHFDLPFEALGILRTDAPHYYRGGKQGESESEFLDRIIGNLEALIEKENPDTIAAFIAEPVNGAGGVIVPPEGYFERVQEVLSKYDILMWADEVITGFGRTGNDFGSTTLNIKPDLMSLAKALSSAYLPISASVIPGWMYEPMVEPSAAAGAFGHGFTYSGHPVPSAVALKTLEIYERDDIFAKAAKTGDYLQAKLRSRFEDHPLVGEVRGVGLVAALELVADKRTKQPFDGGAVGAFIQKRCEDNGLIIRALAGPSVAICPPLIISEAEVDELIDILGKSLEDTMAFAKEQGLLAG